MTLRVSLFTHESIVHDQVDAIQLLLNREVSFAINLNTLKERSTLAFHASEYRIHSIQTSLHFKITPVDGENRPAKKHQPDR